MNRRRFIHQLGSAVAAFTILPSATTYARKWSGTLQPRPWIQSGNLFVPNPDYIKAQLKIHFLYSLKVDPYGEIQTSWIDRIETAEWPSST